MTQAALLATTISQFVAGCKTDGIWDPIKACCIMAAWDGLAGALYPLKGPAPTNFNFVAGDYDRETGLVGDGSTKYLDSNRNRTSDPQDSMHIGVYLTGVNSVGGRSVFGNGNLTTQAGATHYRISTGSDGYYRHSQAAAAVFNLSIPSSGLIAINRGSSVSSQLRQSGVTTTYSGISDGRLDQNLHIYKSAGVSFGTDARLAFYSIGESLDLALLDTRVSDLITAIGAAIP